MEETEGPRTVRAIMTRRTLTVDERERLGVCRSYMRLSGIRHLLVTRASRLAGVLSERDVLAAAANHGVTKAWNMRAGDSMSSRLVTVSPDTTIQEAAREMAERKLGCLPVLANGELVGIVTVTDVLRDRALGEPLAVSRRLPGERGRSGSRRK